MLQLDELKLRPQLNSAKSTMQDLYEANFITSNYYLKKSVSVKLIQTDADYNSVLKLRYETYRAAEKIPAHTVGHESMRVSADSESQIYGVYLNDLLLASVRIFVPQSDSVLESVDMPLGFYPKSFPDKTKVIEVANLCVRLGCRRTDILKSIFDQVHQILVTENRSHILISSDTRLQSKYRFIGFKKSGYSYTKSNSKYSCLHIMISNQKPFGIYGLHGDPIRWNFFLHDISKKLLAENKFKRRWTALAVFHTFRIFKPIADFLERKFIAPGPSQ